MAVRKLSKNIRKPAPRKMVKEWMGQPEVAGMEKFIVWDGEESTTPVLMNERQWYANGNPTLQIVAGPFNVDKSSDALAGFILDNLGYSPRFYVEAE